MDIKTTIARKLVSADMKRHPDSEESDSTQRVPAKRKSQKRERMKNRNIGGNILLMGYDPWMTIEEIMYYDT